MSKPNNVIVDGQKLKKSSTAIKCIVLVVCVILLAGSVVGNYFMWGNALGDSASVDADNFLSAMEESSKVRNADKKYEVTEDITVTAAQINGRAWSSFYGKLEGNGHTITIASDEDGQALQKPLFDIIAEGSSLSALNIVVTAPVGTDGSGAAVRAAAGGDISALARVNHGDVSNCSFVIDKVYVGPYDNSSALINYNFGDLQYICLKVGSAAVPSAYDNEDNWLCRYGSLASVNYGRAVHVLADVRFAVEEGGTELKGRIPAVFGRNYSNWSVGYMVGAFGGDADEKSVSYAYLFGFDKDISDTASDRGVYECRNYYEIVSSDMIDDGWSRNIWSFKEGQFPSLR